jgi:hypothetical protein
MTRVRGDNVQVWATVSMEVNDELEKISERESRKKTEVVAILIEKAIKERKRNRKGKKDAEEV